MQDNLEFQDHQEKMEKIYREHNISFKIHNLKVVYFFCRFFFFFMERFVYLEAVSVSI